jgi:hypothetical protein
MIVAAVTPQVAAPDPASIGPIPRTRSCARPSAGWPMLSAASTARTCTLIVTPGGRSLTWACGLVVGRQPPIGWPSAVMRYS